jgi:hypothetical protein
MWHRLSHRIFVLLAGGACLALAALAGVVLVRGALAQQQQIAVFPDVHQTKTDVTVDVLAQDATNLGAFQMVLSWDPGVVSLVGIHDGGFLGQTGRKPICPQPVVDQAAVRFTCVTVGPVATPAAASAGTPVASGGVAGNGVLAHAEFRVVKNGSPGFHLSRVKLVDPVGTELASKVSDGTTVRISDKAGSSHGWLIAFTIAGVVGLAIVIVAVTLIWRLRGASAARQRSAEEVPGPKA